MKAKKIISIIFIIIISATIAASTFLMYKKPDTGNVSKAQRIAAYSKPAVVRIFNYAIVEWNFSNIYDDEVCNFFKKIQNQTIIGGSGSGAVISSNGYIITNAHVVELSQLNDKDIAVTAFVQLAKQVAAEFNISDNLAAKYLLKYTTYKSVSKFIKVILPNSNTEAMDAEIKSYGAPIGEGKDVAVIKVEGRNYPTLKIGSSNKVQIQDNIWLLGYPGAADSELLSSSSAAVVSITDGKISAVDKKSTQGAPVLQLTAAATHGNSGGPVIDENGNIIGLLTFRGNTVNGQEVQGFNFAVPSETITEFVNQSGAKNEQSEVDTLYKEGLDLYWGGYYKDALVRFEQLKHLNPNHPEVDKLIADSQQNSAHSKILWAKYKNIFIIYDAAAGAGIILIIIFAFILKRKPKEKKDETPPQPQDMQQP